MDFKTIFIACVIACLCGAIVAGVATHSYTASHYELIIKDNEAKQNKALAERDAKVIVAERKNNETTSTLNAQALEYSKNISSMQAKLDRMRSNSGSVFVRANCSNSSTGATSGASNVDSSPIAEPASGIAELPREFAETIIATAIAADELRARAEICKEYAEAVVAQRQRMINDNK